MASWPSSRIRALLGRLVGAAQVLGAVQKRDVRERLREISHLPARGGVIFLREQPHIVAQRQEPLEQLPGIVNPAHQNVNVHQPEAAGQKRSEEHTSELQSLMRNSYAVFCLKKKTTTHSQQ